MSLDIFPSGKKELERRWENNEFAQRVLPDLAKHFARQALNQLQDDRKWLALFALTSPDFGQARNEFLHRGSEFFIALDQHCTLFRLAIGSDGLVCSGYGYTFVAFIGSLQHMEQSDPVATTKHPVRLADKIQKLGKRQEEAGKSSSEYALWGEALEAVQRYERGDIDSPFATFDRVSSAWLTLMAVESPGKKLYSDDFASFCVGLEAEYNAALKLSTPWQIYKRNVKAFTYHVGCPNAHEEPASNIAEMRRFHATQMPFFNKLQQDLAEQVKRNEYQQQIITHLLFRHLLEHLPLRTHPTNASENWMTFWKDACKKASDLSTTDHPLKQLLDLTPGSDHMFNTLSQVTNVRNQIAQWTKQGASYELGCGLYNITSKNIHNYAGDMDGYESAFKAGGHPWPKPLDDMLEALIPINFHPNNHASAGEVDWDKERARYL